jgi:hypothetical protein
MESWLLDMRGFVGKTEVLVLLIVGIHKLYR